MYLSCSCLACVLRDYPALPDALGKIRELGFAAVDLDAFETWQHIKPSELAASEAHRARLAEMIRESGLAVSSINAGLSRSLADTDSAAAAQYGREFEALLDLARRVDCPNVTVQPGGPTDERDDEHSLALITRRLEGMGLTAGGYGISLGVEAHQGSLLESPDAARAVLKQIWPAAGLTYDPSHFAMQQVPLPQTEPLLEYVVHVHVRGAAAGQMQATMEDSTVDLSWLIAALNDVGYEGAVAIEYFNDFDADFSNTLALRDLLGELGVEATPQ